jgi:glycerol-3-phosphate dehydrogenase
VNVVEIVNFQDVIMPIISEVVEILAKSKEPGEAVIMSFDELGSDSSSLPSGSFI